MSTSTSITISPRREGAILLTTVEDVEARFNRDSSHTTDEFDMWDTKPEVHDNGWIHLSFNTKWTVEGLGEFARKLTRQYAGVVVEIEVEWDTRDVDVAGGSRQIWWGGKIRDEFEIGWVRK